MGSVGISFGSATSGTGFDVASTVTSILAINQAIETPWKTQLTALQAQDTVFSTLGTDLSTLSTALGSLTDFDGVTAQKEGSSSNTNALTLSAATSAAVAGSHTISITSLASTSSDYSNSLASASDTLSGTLEIQVGSSDKTITVNSANGNNTLTTLAQAINNGSYGVTASVITDSSGSRLSVVSSTNGAAGQITLTSNLTDTTPSTPVAVSFSQGEPGADAAFYVDGVSTTSASNTVSSVIPGVTFQLLSPTASNAPVQVTITNDNTAIETAVQTFVTAYNAVVSDVTTQEGKDSSGNAEPLEGNPTLALIQEQLGSGILGGAASGAINSTSQLGLTLGQDGKLTLDSSTLDSALNSNFSDVVGFLQNTGSFGQTLTTTLNGLGTSSTTSSISLAQAQNTAEETALNANITNEDASIAAEKTSLTTELNTANQVLQAIPSQLNEVNEIYSALTGYNTNSNG